MKSEAYIANDRSLAEINATLVNRYRDDRGSIGIFLPTGAGDIMTAMGVLKYAEELWGDKNIIWFCNMPNADVFKYGYVSQVRTYQWEGLAVDPFTQLKGDNNRIRQDRKHDFEETADLDDAYFPAPWMYSPKERGRLPLTTIARGCFGLDQYHAWHPLLGFSDEELSCVKDFCLSLPYKKTIMLETDYNSGQSGWDDELTIATMRICRKHIGDCNFIFSTNKDNSRFFDDKGVVSASHFTIRQVALINNFSDLFIGVSSGVSVSTSAWGLKATPKLQYCNSHICSTAAIANGYFELVAPTGSLNTMIDQQAKNKRMKDIFKYRLSEILNKIR